MTIETEKADTLSHASFGIVVPGQSSLKTQNLWEEKR